MDCSPSPHLLSSCRIWTPKILPSELSWAVMAFNCAIIVKVIVFLAQLFLQLPYFVSRCHFFHSYYSVHLSRIWERGVHIFSSNFHKIEKSKLLRGRYQLNDRTSPTYFWCWIIDIFWVINLVIEPLGCGYSPCSNIGRCLPNWWRGDGGGRNCLVGLL